MKTKLLFYLFFLMPFLYGQSVIVITLSSSIDGHENPYPYDELVIENTQNVEVSGEFTGFTVTFKPNTTTGITLKPLNFTGALNSSQGKGTTIVKTGGSGNGHRNLPKIIILCEDTNTLKIITPDGLNLITGQLYNSIGQRLETLTFDDNQQIDVANLAPGVYFLVATDKNGQLFKTKFIKHNN